MNKNENRSNPHTGVLLINVGSPSAPHPLALWRYLAEFLSDPRVLDIPVFFRLLLLYLIILPLRSFTSARLYQKVWLPEGSPLLFHTKKLVHEVSENLGDCYLIKMAMCCGSPSVSSAVHDLIRADVDRILVFPLYPQYASATTGGALEKAGKIINSLQNIPTVSTLPVFYDHPSFISAFSHVIKEQIKEFPADFILFSYHGLPERHIKKSDRSGVHCLVKENCCALEAPEVCSHFVKDKAKHPNKKYCYRSQCFTTTQLLADSLNLSKEIYSTSFQSRFGKDPWIKPYTDDVFIELIQKGIKRLAIVCPAFVIDCLETLEEIGIRGRTRWLELGGEDFKLVSSLNSHPLWVDFIAQRIREHGSI